MTEKFPVGTKFYRDPNGATYARLPDDPIAPADGAREITEERFSRIGRLEKEMREAEREFYEAHYIEPPRT